MLERNAKRYYKILYTKELPLRNRFGIDNVCNSLFYQVILAICQAFHVGSIRNRVKKSFVDKDLKGRLKLSSILVY